MDNELAQSLKTSLTTGKVQDCERFIHLAQPFVASAIMRVLARWGQLSRDRADDLVQDTFTRLYEKNAQALRGFHSDGDGSLAAWLRRVAASVALDSLRSARAERHGSGHAHRDINDPALTLASGENTFKTVERSIFTERVNRCLESQKERDRAIFWLYYRQGFSAKDISCLSAVDLGIKGVETTIYRVTRAVRDCMGESGLATAATGEGSRR